MDQYSHCTFHATQCTHPPTHLPTYPPTHLPTYPPTHLPTYPHTLIPSYPHTHLPTYPPTHIPSVHTQLLYTFVYGVNQRQLLYPVYTPNYPHTQLPTYPSMYPVHTPTTHPEYAYPNTQCTHPTIPNLCTHTHRSSPFYFNVRT